jgi:hypothetical protein
MKNNNTTKVRTAARLAKHARAAKLYEQGAAREVWMRALCDAHNLNHGFPRGIADVAALCGAK